MSNHETTEQPAMIDSSVQVSGERELENHELSDVVGGALSFPSLTNPTTLADLTARLPVATRPIQTNPLLSGFKTPLLRPQGGLDPIGPYSDSIGVGVGCVSWSKDI